MLKEDLKMYLYNVLNLEQLQYEVSNLYNNVFNEKKRLESLRLQEEVVPKIVKRTHDYSEMTFFRLVGRYLLYMYPISFFGYIVVLIIFLVLKFILFALEEHMDLSHFYALCNKISPSAVKALLVCWFLFMLWLIVVSFDEGIKKSDAKKYTKENIQKAEEKNKIIRQYNKNVLFQRKNNLPVYQQEYAVLLELYSKIIKELKEIYSYDVIFPKYRNLISVCSFFEYICSGRCDSLEGYQGAYNIFEMELRQNVIIGKLDQISENLETVAQNQYVLYTKISESNQAISSIKHEMAYQLEKIENNSCIMAYNTKIIARNAEFMKWFNLFQNSHRRVGR